MRLHNPKASTDCLRRQQLHQVPGKRLQQAQRRVLWQPRYSDSGGSVRREPQNIGEVDIQCQKAPLLADAHLVQSLVSRAAEFFL